MRAGFDRLAGIYRWLEFLALGSALERTRFALLDRLGGCRSILVLGEGDGRCLARLVALAPHARIHCVDQSPAMMARAAARLSAGERERVRFECADARQIRLSRAQFDGVVTLFFLDCFAAHEVERLVRCVTAAALPGAQWLFADFALPERGWRKWRARAWLAVLYAFFRWQTRLSARTLPPAEAILARHGWRTREAREFQAGMLRTALFTAAPEASP